MARILITSGPTRQYLDAVRYLTNASSGRMGAALADAAIRHGHEVTIVSGPVEVPYHDAAEVISVVSTEDMLAASHEMFDRCDGMIGAAAPCDYRPRHVEPGKIAKNGEPLKLELVETDDVVATLGAIKGARWVVGFALETEDHRLRALAKLERKHCDLMVSNGTAAMNALTNEVEVIAPSGKVLATLAGNKGQVADGILSLVQRHLVERAEPR